MAHETHQETKTIDQKSVIAFKSSFWLVVILVFLFIGALNFVQVESAPKEEGKANTEMKAGEKSMEKPAEATAPKAEEGKKN